VPDIINVQIACLTERKILYCALLRRLRKVLMTIRDAGTSVMRESNLGNSAYLVANSPGYGIVSAREQVSAKMFSELLADEKVQ
jgi:hypothetical protein